MLTGMKDETKILRQESGRRGGAARARKLSPERRKEISRKGTIAASVNRIVDGWSELSDEQRAAIRARSLQDREV